ncbi:MAG: hypothetical protein CV087_09415 [Candidatus Brocadia sp. WS118]|nr:MAG: hypothetical protein CV087_09415 [Candidatus Brocadia sp. WS118]
MIDKPWVTGPKELILHGIQHLNQGTGFDYRIAMISIDNAVELMIKTYLGLPKRINQIEGITRRRYQEMCSTFPNLLDGLEEFASEKLTGIELGDIEWYHRLRNQLYHDGNGITVEKEKVETYAELAKILFENLFGVSIEINGEDLDTGTIGKFIHLWSEFEKLLLIPELPDKDEKWVSGSTVKGTLRYTIYLKELLEKRIISQHDIREINNLRIYRNELVHGLSKTNSEELKNRLESLKRILMKIRKK